MAGARKLQAEIDRCLKKVAEGVEKFEETWQKVHNASNTNQKEKYEEDLKKEIKKLQRLRDQIKTWLASGEIKDKSTLMENRKLIETQMERFKIVERETKTKAYSKEGLTASARMDPAERERCDMMGWLNQCIDTLNIQVDQFEAEIESLVGTGGKKKKGKSDADARTEECQSWVEKHRDHIQKLETLLRMLDNDQVSVSQVQEIREEVDNYIENSQEPGFYENEYIYDDIEGLEEMLLDIGAPEHNSVESSEVASSTNSVSGHSPIPNQDSRAHNHSNSESGRGGEDDLKRRHRSSQSDDTSKAVKKSSSSGGGGGVGGIGTAILPPSPLPASRSIAAHTPTKSTAPVNAYSLSQSPNNSSPSSGPTGQLLAGLSNHLLDKQNFAAAAATHNGHASGEREREVTSPPGLHQAPGLSLGAGIGSSFPKLMQNLVAAPVTAAEERREGQQPGSYPHQQVRQGEEAARSVSGPLQMNGVGGGSAVGAAPTSSAGLQLQLQQHGKPQQAQGGQQQQQELPDSLSSLKSLAEAALPLSSHMGLMQQNHSSELPPGYLDLSGGLQEMGSGGRSGQKTEAHIPPLLGVAPLGVVPLSKEHQFQYTMLEAASHHLPHPSDSERLRPYLPRNPCHTPLYYPQAPPPGSDTIDFFQRLSTETLFFIFYYMEGTKAQYLAAKALKKQSWRFHTKYMMWFQRHEEPKIINDEYEQGTYIYFDYEKWGQRKKEGFTFEYRFLEDRDLN